MGAKRTRRWWLLIVALPLAAFGTYWGSMVLFFYRSNQVIRIVLTEVKHDNTDLGRVHGIQRLCKSTGQGGSEGSITASWDCAHTGVLPTYLITNVFTFISQSHASELETVGAQVSLPRRHWEPVALTIVRLFDKPGTAVHVKVLYPNAIKAADVSVARDAVVSIHLKYKCSLPFSGCQSFEDFVEIK